MYITVRYYGVDSIKYLFFSTRDTLFIPWVSRRFIRQTPVHTLEHKFVVDLREEAARSPSPSSPRDLCNCAFKWPALQYAAALNMSSPSAKSPSPTRGRKNKDTEAWVRSVMENAITSKRHKPSKLFMRRSKLDAGLRPFMAATRRRG